MTRKTFKEERDRAIAKREGSPEEREATRKWILDAIDDDSVVQAIYRIFPDGFEVDNEYYPFSIERDIICCLPAFEERFDAVAIHNWKLLRRFLLERYAYSAANVVDEKLGSRERWIWLKKDHFIPRIGLALILGFGGVLGVSPVWNAVTRIGGEHKIAAVVLTALCLAIVLVLIFLNVRGCIGKAHALPRAVRVWVVSIGWMSFAVLAWWFLYYMMKWTFDGWKAALTGSAALLLAVLSQFFFGQGEESIGKPL